MKMRTISKAISAVLSAAMLVTSLPAMALAAPPDTRSERTASKEAGENLLKLWYDEPASRGVNILSAGAYSPSAEDNNWQQHTLPIGNSFMGANVYGEIARERLTFNQKTLWNGGPSASRPNYNGGNKDRSEQYQEIVNQFLAGNDAAASRLCDQYLTGEGENGGYGVYQSWGDIYLNYKDLANVSDAANYERNLDLTEGIANVDFETSGVTYHREYFVSYPDNVLAMKLTTDSDRGMNLNVSFPIDNGETAAEQANITNSRLGKNVTYQVDAAAGTIVNAGSMQDNQMKLNSMLKVVAGGGSITKGGDNQSLDVTDAKEVIIFISADTDYKNVYPSYRTGETDEQLAASVKKTVDNAAAKGYDRIKSRHLMDYQELFDRVDLDLGQTASDKTTDALLAAYKAGGNNVTDAEKRLLEVLLYQYGRYLTIASSRDGDLPSNLQGVWQNRVGTSGKVPWGSDFHMNVNLQMNYWPTYSANLAECATPLVDYVNSLREPGRVTAESYYGIKSEPGEANGFTAHTQNTPFGWTCPGWAFSWGWSPAAVPWILQNCWEYYEYTGDLDYMRENLYPMMKEETILYDQILVDSGAEITLSDGRKSTRLVSAPAYSPELGPYTLGNVYENGLIWQLYEDTITAAKLLKVDSDLVARWEETKERLAPIEVGDSGQIKEWYHETTIGSVANMTNHRHMSHLLELFPGDLISVENEDYMDAAVVSLLDRGDTSTGWGMGQRINAWARTGDGNHAYVLIQSLFNNGIYPNLWDAHPPFQIDGNFGYTSGVNEMLMQSNVGYINILPALPDAWSAGSVDGIVARGNFELGIDWTDKKATEVRILSKNGEPCSVQYPGIGTATVKDSKGQTVTCTAVEGKANRITFDTVKGETYTITNMGEDARLEAPVNCKAQKNGNNIVLTWDAVAGADAYNIYRKVTTNAVSEKINTQAVTANTYTDSADSYEDVYGVQYIVVALKSGQEGIYSEKFQVPAPQLPIEVIDETDGRIEYTGTWGSWSEGVHYGGGIKFIESAAGTEAVELPFEGTGIVILARKNNGRYDAQWKVYIDDEEAGVADCGATLSVFQDPVFANYDLPPGQHTIKLTTEGNAGKKIELDGFIVYANKDAGITVSYDLGEKEGNVPASSKQKCRDIITLPACDVNGFEGWSDGNRTYSAGTSYQLNYSDITFKAVFEDEEEENNTSDEYISLSKRDWTATAGSEHNAGNDGPASSAIDGNNETWWHSNYGGNNEATFGENGEHNEFTIDFGKEVTIDKFEYVPRTTSLANGFITEYKLLSSQTADGNDFVEIASGQWNGTLTDRKLVAFEEAKTMRRIQIRAIHTDGSLGKDRYIHASEFNVYKKNPNYVPPVPPSGIKLESDNITLELGESKALNAEVEPADATNKNLTYTSSDPMKVFVYPNGTITASKYNYGTATITITASGDAQVTKTVNVTVNPPAAQEITGIHLEKDRVVLKPGEETSVGVTIEPYFGTDKTITWESSAPAVVTVTDGKIQAAAEGRATITAKTVNNKTATCQVLVSATEADRTELQGMVSEMKIKYKDLSKYTEEQQAEFLEAMSDAEEVLAYGSNVIQSELDDAVEALNAALRKLLANETFTIRFHANGGNEAGLPNNITGKKIGDKVTLPTAELTREGYTFKGWSTNSYGSAQDVITEVTVDISDIVVYAIWEREITYKVTFEANADGDNSVAGMPEAIEGKKTGEKVSLADMAAPTREGYIFKGWSKEADSQTLVTELTLESSDITVYAVWEKENTYKVTFEANADGDNSVTGMPKAIEGKKTGEKVSLTNIAAPTRAGYSFKGWSKTTDGKNLVTELTIADSDLTVYAVWEKENTYKVTFEANAGGDSSVAGMPKAIEGKKTGEKVSLTNIAAPTRTGYSFKGWSQTADGKTLVTELIIADSDLTVYAVWVKDSVPVSYTVTFKGNGATSGVPASSKVVSGTSMNQPKEKPVRAGYTFQGWSKTENGAVITWPQKITQNTTFYAVWKKQTPQLRDGMKLTDKKTKITYKVVKAKNKTAMVVKGTDKKAQSVTIPSTITIAGVNCKVITIHKGAFKSYNKLKKVTIGSNVTEIGKDAFKNCTKLGKVTMGKKVKVIEKNAFYGCKKLDTVTLKSMTLKSVKSGAFKNTSKTLTFKVPKGVKKAQKNKLLKELKKGGNKKVKVK